MFKPRHLAIALIATTPLVPIPLAHAQQIPSAGTQLQQLPAPPTPEKPVPDLDIGHRAAPAEVPDGGPAVRVNALRVTGATEFSEAELLAATGFAPGDFTLSDLRRLAARITDYYHVRGYFLAQAYLPAQDVQGGTIALAVLEGRYGKVAVHNSARIADGVPAARLHGLDAGDLIANAPLERRLLLLSDIPGIRVKATLAPGSDVGTSDLIVDVTPGPLISGSLEADNGGSRYTGEWRFGGSVNLNNPLGIGDQLSLRILASDGGLAYGRASYQVPLGDLTLGVAYAHLRYELGDAFAALDGTGTADIASVYASYPLIRSRRGNLNAVGDFDYNWLHDRIGTVPSDSIKRVAAGTIGFAGDWRDGAGGSNVFSIGGTVGSLELRSPADQATDRITAHSAGGFGKMQGGYSRLQSIAGPLSLYASVRGQLAFDNLDSSQKIELGGINGVRAYPEGEAFGDTGYIATIEPRLMLGGNAQTLPGRFELIGFIDTGEVRFAQSPWFAGSNHARRTGYGGGVDWSGPQGLLVKVSYARRWDTGPATSAPDSDGRFWFQFAKLF